MLCTKSGVKIYPTLVIQGLNYAGIGNFTRVCHTHLVPTHSFHCNQHRSHKGRCHHSRPCGQPECTREQRAECARLAGSVRQLGRARWWGHRHLQRLLEYQQLVRQFSLTFTLALKSTNPSFSFIQVGSHGASGGLSDQLHDRQPRGQSVGHR